MRFGLLFDESELEKIRDKIERYRWAAGGYRRLRRQADAIFMSDKISNETVKAIECASILYAISGDAEYAERSEELIRGCAAFPELFGSAVSDTYDFGCNTLLTGYQLVRLSISFDLLWDYLSEEGRSCITDDLILPATKHLRTNDRMDSNWQTSHSLGLLSAGLAIADEKLSDFALNDKDHGLRRHMAVSFRRDGLQWEGSFSYHSSTLSHLMLAAEMARHVGIDLFSEGEETPYIKRMLDVPIKTAFPDMSLPSNNDSGAINLSNMYEHYELGYARYRDPAYGWIIEKSDRTSVYSLIFGEGTIESGLPESRSLSLEQTGWTCLKSVEGEGYWGSDGKVVTLDYGPHGDWHGHPDKLGIEFFSNGLRWIQDAGSPVGYMCQQHWEYFRTTLAHNTVVVDFKNQQFERAGDNAAKDLEHTGNLICFSPDGKQKIVAASVDWAYDGVHYERTLTLSGDLLIDLFKVSSDNIHTYDYILHGRGVVQAITFEMERSRLPQTEGGYEYFVNVKRAGCEDDWAVIFNDGGWPDGKFAPTGKQLEVSMEKEEGTEIYTGYSPSNLMGVNTPFILVRRRTRRTVFRSKMRAMQPS
jgi:hypothetical protein